MIGLLSVSTHSPVTLSHLSCSVPSKACDKHISRESLAQMPGPIYSLLLRSTLTDTSLPRKLHQTLGILTDREPSYPTSVGLDSQQDCIFSVELLCMMLCSTHLLCILPVRFRHRIEASFMNDAFCELNAMLENWLCHKADGWAINNCGIFAHELKIK